MTKQAKKYISTNSSILGGEPVIAGTRIPLVRLYELVKQGHSPFDIQEQYPWVDTEKIQMAMAYMMKIGLDDIKETKTLQSSSR